MEKRYLQLLKQIINYMGEELDPYEHPNKYKWACEMFGITEDEMKKIKNV